MELSDSGPLRLEGRTLAERYALLEEVASGGMGTVWRGRDEVLGRAVAVKILHDRLAREPDVLERFRLEAVAAARLSHPNVVRVFDTGVDDGVAFIVMELFEGETLEDQIRSGPLEPRAAATVLRGVLQGLAHAHREGVIHRDVKPGNVLIDERSGLVKVADFGIAKAAFATSDLTTTGDLLGTARYLAPEQVAGASVDHRADLYAAGVVLYESLTGRPPFDGETHIAVATKRLTTDPPPPGALRPGIPRPLEAATMRALARDPDARFQTAEEMNAALDRAAPRQRPGGAPAPRTDDRRPARGSVFRSWMAVPLILIALAALAVVGFTLAAPLFDGGGGGAGAEDDGSLQRLDIRGAEDYDPYGDDGESPETVGAAFDGSEETAWTTEGYEQSDLFGKPGVGLAFDLGSTEEISSIRLETDIEGWKFELHAGDQIDGLDEADALQSDGETTFTARSAQRLDLDEPVEARYVLVWITEAVQADDAFRASITEARVFGPGG
ncbi:MAG TPA: protein kinase [Actinomycetota bacterium]|nr:protein kinase [Actinomycetota bacterium]